MKLLLDSFWRATAYLLLPRVVGLSMLPLLIAGGLSLLWGYLFWEDAVATVRAALERWVLIEAGLHWLAVNLGEAFRSVMAPLIVVVLAIPVVVVMSLLLVALLMTPAMVSLVAERRFAGLERKHGAGFWQSALWSLGYTGLALLCLLVSAPLWLIPPLVLLVPPLIWGWLTMRVMSFDVLAEHASPAERARLLSEHRWPLLLIGVVTGYLGAAPGLLWAVSAASLIFAPVLIALSVWLYTLVFAFASLWFTHYALAALQLQRLGTLVPQASPSGVIDTLPGNGRLPPPSP